ncbi:MAG TPA: type II toxin-antitoxin system prevent-host-death family antitoxin [Candidatus Saccharimonadales bacterium]|nr:type II toxin-antitoxin system prevent-host-death family antitoxin [Candidatus Saccharimonadales bacterium]
MKCPAAQPGVVPYLVQVLGVRQMAVTASDARKRLFPLIEQANNDQQPIEITSKRGDAVLLSRADFDALQETAWLLRVPANARRLLESLAQAHDGERLEHERG